MCVGLVYHWANDSSMGSVLCGGGYHAGIMNAIHTPPRRVSLPQCPHQPQPYAGPSRDEVLAQRREFLNPALFHLYTEPLMIVEGHMQYVWDDRGTRRAAPCNAADIPL